MVGPNNTESILALSSESASEFRRGTSACNPLVDDVATVAAVATVESVAAVTAQN